MFPYQKVVTFFVVSYLHPDVAFGVDSFTIHALGLQHSQSLTGLKPSSGLNLIQGKKKNSKNYAQ